MEPSQITKTEGDLVSCVAGHQTQPSQPVFLQPASASLNSSVAHPNADSNSSPAMAPIRSQPDVPPGFIVRQIGPSATPVAQQVMQRLPFTDGRPIVLSQAGANIGTHIFVPVSQMNMNHSYVQPTIMNSATTAAHLANVPRQPGSLGLVPAHQSPQSLLYGPIGYIQGGSTNTSSRVNHTSLQPKLQPNTNIVPLQIPQSPVRVVNQTYQSGVSGLSLTAVPSNGTQNFISSPESSGLVQAMSDQYKQVNIGAGLISPALSSSSPAVNSLDPNNSRSLPVNAAQTQIVFASVPRNQAPTISLALCSPSPQMNQSAPDTKLFYSSAKSIEPPPYSAAQPLLSASCPNSTVLGSSAPRNLAPLYCRIPNAVVPQRTYNFIQEKIPPSSTPRKVGRPRLRSLPVLKVSSQQTMALSGSIEPNFAATTCISSNGSSSSDVSPAPTPSSNCPPPVVTKSEALDASSAVFPAVLGQQNQNPAPSESSQRPDSGYISSSSNFQPSPPATNALTVVSGATTVPLNNPDGRPINGLTTAHNVLTHVIDGFVIQEASTPFPVRGHTLHDMDGESSGRASRQSSVSVELTPSIGAQQPAESGSSGRHGICQACGRKTLVPSRRFCSKKCQKQFKQFGALTQGVPSLTNDSDEADDESSTCISMKQSDVDTTSISPKISPAKANRISPISKSALSVSVSVESSPTGSQVTSRVEPILPRLSSSPCTSTSTRSNVNPSPQSTSSLMHRKPEDWTVDDVYQFVLTTIGCDSYAPEFREQEIDGQALLLLEVKHLVDQMGFKLGPALKLLHRISRLRDDPESA